jgi:hypothetical protein
MISNTNNSSNTLNFINPIEENNQEIRSSIIDNTIYSVDYSIDLIDLELQYNELLNIYNQASLSLYNVNQKLIPLINFTGISS